MMLRKCVNSPPTGGRKEPLNSQNPKLAAGAQRVDSGHPVHTGVETPCPRGPVRTIQACVHVGPMHTGSKPCAHGGTQNSLQQPTETCITLAYEL
jgi:hypothetical protein